jgi:hypothetical protein
MNMREGMRRVGIVLGALGCVAGGAIGYWDLQNVWSSHTRFERLQALPVMLDVNAAIKDYRDSLAKQHEHETFTDLRPLPPLPPGATPYPPGFVPDKGIPPLPPGATQEPPGTVTITPDFIPDYVARAANAHDKAVADDPAADITVDVKGTDGIQTVNADKGGVTSSIQLTAGEWVRRGAKTLKGRLALVASLLLPFCYPVIGFLVPWGTIRVFVWVAGGFSGTPNPT